MTLPHAVEPEPTDYVYASPYHLTFTGVYSALIYTRACVCDYPDWTFTDYYV